MTLTGTILRCTALLALPYLVACSAEARGTNPWTGDPPSNSSMDSGAGLSFPDWGPPAPSSDMDIPGGGAPAKPDQGTGTFPPVPGGNYSANGPHGSTDLTNVGPNKGFSVYRPAVLGQGGVKHPIITWGNSAGMTSKDYVGLLRHWATHGFVVIASDSKTTGNGKEMVKGIDWLVNENKRAGSVFHNKLDPSAMGASGHFEGGGASINAANDARVKCSAPLMPLPGKVQGVKGPMLMVTSELDGNLFNGYVKKMVYDPSPVPTCLARRKGVDHYAGSGSAKAIRGYVTAMFRLCLMGEISLMKLFYGTQCGICTDPNWTVECKDK